MYEPAPQQMCFASMQAEHLWRLLILADCHSLNTSGSNSLRTCSAFTILRRSRATYLRDSSVCTELFLLRKLPLDLSKCEIAHLYTK